ncbi:MAG: peptidyl-prolyl cis-trans isomerase [Paludibacter sp.]|nr:peptidyl-prolyl cis-trans isomerase [Paludibacter sp.]
MKIGKFLISFLMFAAMSACVKPTADSSRTPLLEVEGKFLYLDEVLKVIPSNLSADDSVKTANSYIKQWVIDVLLYENARRNITDRREINELIAVYEKSLIVQQYRQKILEQRLPKMPTDAELQDFYANYKNQLLLNENLVNGILLVVPNNAPDIGKVRLWVRSGNTEALENIEKYSLQNAISYEYFGNEWKSLSEILNKTAFRTDNPVAFVKQSNFYETQDSARHYFLKIIDCKTIGEPQPFEIAKPQIINIIQNKKRQDFIYNFNNELYNDAIKNDLITYF